MSKMGVFLSEEGGELAPLDLQAIATRLEQELQEVDHVLLHPDLNSVEGIGFLKESIAERGLTYVVVGSGSAERREDNVREAVRAAGANPYLLELVNLREGVAWVHDDTPEEANQKAFHLLRTAIKRVQQGTPLDEDSIRVEQQVLVVGGGVAGLTAASRLADAGYTAVIVEKRPSLGGRLAQLDRLWPRLDEAEALVRDLMIKADQHENIVVYDYSEVEGIEGVPGNFEVAIRRKPRYIDSAKMDRVEEAMEATTVEASDEWQAGLARRKAFYVPFPGAVPPTPLVDPDHASTEALRGALDVLPEGAIDLSDSGSLVHERVGAIILAVGGTPFDPAAYTHLGAGQTNVISALQMERLLARRGPTGGEVLRPADGGEPGHLAWIVDVGAQDDQRGVPYVSEVPLMVAAKQAILVKKALPEAECVVVYKDMRCHTRGYREFVRTAEEEYGVEFVRGEAGSVSAQGDGLVVGLYDLVQGKEIRLDADLCVLVTDVVPHTATEALAKALHIGVSTSGFVEETHPALDPCATPNTAVFVAGDCAAPGDIRAAAMSAEAAVSKALGVLGKKKGSPYRLVIRDPNDSRYDIHCLRVAPDQFERAVDEDGRQRVRLLGAGGVQSGAAVPASPTRNIELTGWELQKSLAELDNLWVDRLAGANGTAVAVAAPAEAPQSAPAAPVEEAEPPPGSAAEGEPVEGAPSDVVSQAEAVVAEADTWNPRITGFVSQHGGYPLLEMLGRERFRYSTSYRFLRIWSTAHLDPLLVLKAFFRGADGVIVVGGPLGRGRFHKDNHLAKRRLDALAGVLEGAGIEPERMQVLFLGPLQANELGATLKSFHARVERLGPLGLGVAS